MLPLDPEDKVVGLACFWVEEAWGIPLIEA
jgi:hypothetical protein